MPSDDRESEPDSLARLILDQSMEGVAVPVLLFGPDGGDHEGPASTESAPEATDLWSPEAYVLQCRYGAQLLDSLRTGGSA